MSGKCLPLVVIWRFFSLQEKVASVTSCHIFLHRMNISQNASLRSSHLAHTYRNSSNFFFFFIAFLSLHCCCTLILISNYDHKVCGSVWVPWMTTQETSAHPQCTSHRAALPVVAASGKPIMAFNWDFNCVRWSKSTDYKTGGIWVHTCILCVSIRIAHQKSSYYLGLWAASGRIRAANTVSNQILHDPYDKSIVFAYGGRS